MCYQATKSLPGYGFLTLNVVDEGRSISNEPMADSKQQYSFTLYAVDSTEMHSLKMEYAEFDALFRFHADLMNPNRKADRFFYVLERLELAASPAGGITLSIAGAAVGDQCHVPAGSTVQIPIGKLTIQDRLELRRALQGLNAIRDANIAAKKEHAHAEFMKIIDNNKKQAERKMQVRQEAIQREREQRRLFHLEERKEQMQKEAEIQAIKDKRNYSITQIERRRQQAGGASTANLLASMDAADDAHAQAVAAWKDKRRRAIQANKAAQAEEAATNERLDGSRQKTIDERLRAWADRKAAWLVRFKRDEERRAKKERVLREKKQEVVYELDVLRKKVWEDIASLRRERDEVLRFCRGEDQLDVQSAVLSPTAAAGDAAASVEDSRRSSIKVSVAPSVLVIAKPDEARKKHVEDREHRRNAEEGHRAAQLRDKKKRAELKKEIEKKKAKLEREEQQRQLKAKKLKEDQDRKRKAKLREENIARRHY